MNDAHDFSALRNLLALKKNDHPKDTQVEEFLAEFHRRQQILSAERKAGNAPPRLVNGCFAPLAHSGIAALRQNVGSILLTPGLQPGGKPRARFEKCFNTLWEGGASR